MLGSLVIIACCTTGLSCKSRKDSTMSINIKQPKSDGNSPSNSTSVAFETAMKAMGGDQSAATKLILGQLIDDIVPRNYYSVISAENGCKDLRLAESLYWSGNMFNKIRSVYWCKNVDSESIEDTLWSGRSNSDGSPYNPKERSLWKDIFKIEVQESLTTNAIKKINVDRTESDFLKLHVRSALMGSGAEAKILWKYYYSILNDEGLPPYFGGYDWISLCQLNLQGFPGPRTIDKCTYWMLIAAENGDPESQWQLANFLDNQNIVSRRRHQFWLEKASVAGFEKAKKQVEKGK